MNAVAEREDTIRERIVQEVMRRLRAMDPDQGDQIGWNEVVRHRLEDLADERVAGDVCAVFDTTETYDYLSGCTECTLTLQVEWWARVETGEDGAALDAERALKPPVTVAVVARILRDQEARRPRDEADEEKDPDADG